MQFRVGQQVRLRRRPAQTGEVLEIVHLEAADEPWYRVRFPSGSLSVSQSSLTSVEIPADPDAQLDAGLVGGMPELRLLLTSLRLKERNLTDQLRSLKAARLQHLPYQYKPLIKFLESDEQRVLIADEVGLGKTIEAGLILLELMARQEVQRVLIVVPSNLITKWQMELAERFGLEFEHRDNRWFREFILKPAENGTEPAPFRAVCGLEALRLLDQEFEALKPSIDLVIIDEAHRLRNDGSRSHRLGRALGESADAMLLCSATPMQTSSTDLHNLLRVMLGERAGSFSDFQADLASNRPIVLASTALGRGAPMSEISELLEAARAAVARGRPSDLPLLDACIETARQLDDCNRSGRLDLFASVNRLNWFGAIMTRTRKRMVMPNVAPRVARAVELDFTEEEMDVYRRVCDMTRQATTGEHRGAGTFAAIMRQRKAASCLAALRQEDAVADSDAVVALRSEMELEDDPHCAALTTAPPLETDSKLDAFMGLLAQLRSENPEFKLIVFATFRATIGHLSSKLREQGWIFEVLTGAVDRHERVRKVHRVKSERGCNILLATEVGCEGIDLQFAETLVNYDLPWNPMTVEQRIGRLDRIGQKAEHIRIFNLSVHGTVEERILNRLYARLRLFEESIGALEVIVGERVQKLALDLARLSPEEQDRRLVEEQLALEAMQRDAARLDAEAVNLVGDDAWYSQRLTEIEAKQGDIAQDLRVFVSDFLGREFKKAALVEEDRVTSPGVMRMTFDSDLLAFVQSRRELFGAGSTFVGRYAEHRDDGIRITFDQGVAEDNRDVEFLTTTHGLVRAIVNQVDEHESTPVRCFSVRLKREGAAGGTWLIGVTLHRVSGIRPRNELVCAAVPLLDGPPLDDENADTLLARVLRAAESAVDQRPPVECLAAARARADRALLLRCQRTKGEVERDSQVSVGRRIDSLRRWFGARIEKASRLATSHPDPRIRRMWDGRVLKLQARLSDQVAKAESARLVESEAVNEAYVIVTVA